MKNDVSQEEDCSTKQEQYDKRPICDFEARIIRRSLRTIKCDHRRRAYRTIAFKTKKRMKI